MSILDGLGTAVGAGAGLVHRDAGVALLFPAVTAAHAGVIARLLAAFTSPLEPTGHRPVRAMAAILADADPAEVPAFAALLDVEGGLVLLAHAQAVVVLRSAAGQHDPLRMSGTDSLAWVERIVRGPVHEVLLSGTASPEPVQPAGPVVPIDLIRGTVPGGSVCFTSRSLPLSVTDSFTDPFTDSVTTASRPAVPLFRPVNKPSSPDPQGPAVLAGTAMPVSARSPVVAAAECSRGHFNDPGAAYCAICGISLQQRTRYTVLRPRPPLGVLVLDDGTAISVDGDHVLGRDPQQHPAVLAGEARPLVLNDDVSGVSRVHARITLADWTVCVTDEGSANGTYLVNDEGSCAVGRDEPAVLGNGTVLRLGRRTLTFHSYHSGGE